MKKVIGSVPYLNGKPLNRWFTDTPEGRATGIGVVEAVPSRLATMLERGEIAAALVSSIEYFRHPGLTYAPGIAVAAKGPVRSVRMLSKVPVAEIRTVTLDTSSLTSVTLLKILLKEMFGVEPRYLPHPPNLAAMLAEADAALLIGDLGYRDYGPEYRVLDLGEAWHDLTGLPFVYALWIGPEAALDVRLRQLLLEAKEWGKRNPEWIARAEFERLDESYDRAYSYLTEVMRYDLDAEGEEALRLFGEKARRHGLVPGR